MFRMKVIASLLALLSVVSSSPISAATSSSALTAAQQAKNLNAALAALIVEAAINSLLNSKPAAVVSVSVSVTPTPAVTSVSRPADTTSSLTLTATTLLSTPRAPAATTSSVPANTGKLGGLLNTPTSFSTGGTTNVINNCVNPGEFAMTFDDGPYIYGKEITDVFSPTSSLATFFVNGFNYDCIYDKADELIARYQAGHQIASHTWTHVDITTISADQLNNQITLVETALWKILGVRPHHFRPPYGSYNDAAVKVLANRGYQTVIWSDDDGDSVGSTVEQSLADYEAIYPTYPAPHNVLNHETYPNTAEKIIPVVVPKLIAAGWKLVTLATW